MVYLTINMLKNNSLYPSIYNHVFLSLVLIWQPTMYISEHTLMYQNKSWLKYLTAIAYKSHRHTDMQTLTHRHTHAHTLIHKYTYTFTNMYIQCYNYTFQSSQTFCPLTINMSMQQNIPCYCHQLYPLCSLDICFYELLIFIKLNMLSNIN